MFTKLKDLFRSFHSHNVRYLVIGGIAAVIHGVPRTTFDLDLIIEATPENAARLLDALVNAGIGTALLTTPEALISHEISIFKDRIRIDVQTKTPGISFEDAWNRKITMTYQSQEFYILSKEDLIASKRASGRPIDIEDVRILSQE